MAAGWATVGERCDGQGALVRFLVQRRAGGHHHGGGRLEPRAASPHRRLRTIETLGRAGVPVGVSVSPVIPFLNEPELERILGVKLRGLK